MNFGEALRAELIQIQQISQKVFPIVAPKDAESAYLVYRRGESEFKKTLSGTSNKCHAMYELVLVAKSYSEKETIESFIVEKLLSFLNRNIGISGPCIQNVTVKFTGEGYSYETDSLTSTLSLEVDY